jgi:hypothetical protein
MRTKLANVQSIISKKYSPPAFSETIKEFVAEDADVTAANRDNEDAAALLESNISRMYYLFHKYREEIECKRARPETLLVTLDNIMSYKTKLRKHMKQDISKLLTHDRVRVTKRMTKPLYEADSYTKRLERYAIRKKT